MSRQDNGHVMHTYTHLTSASMWERKYRLFPYEKCTNVSNTNMVPSKGHVVIRIAIITIIYFVCHELCFAEDLKECGISKFNMHRQPRLHEKLLKKDREMARVIGGLPSSPGEWPWQVTVQLRHPRWGFMGHWCGGVLISAKWVLTGGHCVAGRGLTLVQPELWTVILGKQSLGLREKGEKSVRVTRVILHDNFQEFKHDIALFKLAATIAARTPNFTPAICLPNPELTGNDTLEGLRCVATGWGRTKNGDRVNSDILREVMLPIVSNSLCSEAYADTFQIPIQDYHICAGGFTDGGKGTCIGDSGGPLQCPIHDGTWYLVGLTSFGSGCARPGVPDVFIRISHFMSWIKDKMDNF